MTELETIAKLLEDLLNPIRGNIVDLKESQKQIMTLLLTQARQEEKMKRIDEHLQDCVNWRRKTETLIDDKFSKLNEKEIQEDKKKELVLWDIIKVLLYILAGGTVGSAISKLILH